MISGNINNLECMTTVDEKDIKIGNLKVKENELEVILDTISYELEEMNRNVISVEQSAAKKNKILINELVNLQSQITSNKKYVDLLILIVIIEFIAIFVLAFMI